MLKFKRNFFSGSQALRLVALLISVPVFAQSPIKNNQKNFVAEPDHTRVAPKIINIIPDAPCNTVDLNAPKDSPFRNIPIYDQDGSGTCYAHAAAQIIDYWRLKHGTPPSDLLNPIYLSWLNSYQARNIVTSKSDTWGGSSAFPLEAICSDLKDNGYCKNDRVQDCLKEFKQIGQMSDAELVHFLETLYDNYTVFTLENSASRAIRKTSDDLYLQGRCEIKKLGSLVEIKKLLGISSTKVLAELFQKCQPATPLKNLPEPRVYKDTKDADLRNQIDKALDNKSPLSTGFCSSVLYDTQYRGLKGNIWASIGGRGANGNLDSNCGSHEAVISARKNFNGVCKYMIRNSWGSLWHPSGIDCACIEDDGTYEDVCLSKFPKEFVGCWYRRSDLIPNILEASSL